MPEPPPEQPLIPLVPSVLDRLIDVEPDVSRDPPRGHGQVLRDVLKSVRRDLENLLNTRVRCKPLPADLEEVHQSLVSYGIPDLTAASMGTKEERDRFCTVLLAIIARCDKRLHKVKVRSPSRTSRPSARSASRSRPSSGSSPPPRRSRSIRRSAS